MINLSSHSQEEIEKYKKEFGLITYEQKAWLAEHDRRIVQEAFKSVEVEDVELMGVSEAYDKSLRIKREVINASNAQRLDKEKEYLKT